MIETSYQDVLTWARRLGNAATFTDRIDRPGSPNADMRGFVGTFKAHLRDAGSSDDNETVWRLLRRLQILVLTSLPKGLYLSSLLGSVLFVPSSLTTPRGAVVFGRF
jgi:hypothetical protein